MKTETERPDVEAMTEMEIRAEQKRLNGMITAKLEEISEAEARLHELTSYKDELDAELKKIYAAGEGELQ